MFWTNILDHTGDIPTLRGAHGAIYDDYSKIYLFGGAEKLGSNKIYFLLIFLLKKKKIKLLEYWINLIF